MELNQEYLSVCFEFLKGIEKNINQGDSELEEFRQVILMEFNDCVFTFFDTINYLYSGRIDTTKMLLRKIFERFFRITLLFYSQDKSKERYVKWQREGSLDYNSDLSYNTLSKKFFTEDSVTKKLLDISYKLMSGPIHGNISGSIDNQIVRINQFWEYTKSISEYIEWMVHLMILYFMDFLPVNLRTNNRMITINQYIHDIPLSKYYHFDGIISEEEAYGKVLDTYEYFQTKSIDELENEFNMIFDYKHEKNEKGNDITVVIVTHKEGVIDIIPEMIDTLKIEKIYTTEDLQTILYEPNKIDEVRDGKEVDPSNLVNLFDS